jgi:hypothetical protein
MTGTTVKPCTNPGHTGPNPLPLDAFYEDASKASGRMSQCRDCIRQRRQDWAKAHRAEHAANSHNWRMANPEKAIAMRARQTRREQRHRGAIHEQLWEAQGGLCYLCEEPLPPIGSRGLHIDHDHGCCPAGRSCPNCRRGLAHFNCNAAIGNAGDDPVRLRRMAGNLECAQERPRKM